MNVTVEYFAQFRTAAGVDRETFDLEKSATLGDLISLIRTRHHGLFGSGEEIPGWVTIVVGNDAVRLNHPLADGDTVRLLAPISGG